MVSRKIWSIRTKHFHQNKMTGKNVFPNDVERTVGYVVKVTNRSQGRTVENIIIVLNSTTSLELGSKMTSYLSSETCCAILFCIIGSTVQKTLFLLLICGFLGIFPTKGPI